MYTHIYIYTHTHRLHGRAAGQRDRAGALHSAKGGVAEAGCSDLYDVIY